MSYDAQAVANVAVEAVHSIFRTLVDAHPEKDLAGWFDYFQAPPFGFPEAQAKAVANFCNQLRDGGEPSIAAWRWFLGK